MIEQAKGILMAWYGCTPDEAFDLLRRASQHDILMRFGRRGSMAITERPTCFGPPWDGNLSLGVLWRSARPVQATQQNVCLVQQ